MHRHRHGALPLKHSFANTPSACISESSETSPLSICSGAPNPGVPTPPIVRDNS